MMRVKIVLILLLISCTNAMAAFELSSGIKRRHMDSNIKGEIDNLKMYSLKVGYGFETWTLAEEYSFGRHYTGTGSIDLELVNYELITWAEKNWFISHSFNSDIFLTSGAGIGFSWQKLDTDIGSESSSVSSEYREVFALQIGLQANYERLILGSNLRFVRNGHFVGKEIIDWSVLNIGLSF